MVLSYIQLFLVKKTACAGYMQHVGDFGRRRRWQTPFLRYETVTQCTLTLSYLLPGILAFHLCWLSPSAKGVGVVSYLIELHVTDIVLRRSLAEAVPRILMKRRYIYASCAATIVQSHSSLRSDINSYHESQACSSVALCITLNRQNIFIVL